MQAGVWPSNIPLQGLDHILRSPLGGHQVVSALTITNSAANTHVRVFMGTWVFTFLGHTPRRGISGPSGDSVLNFSVICQTLLHLGLCHCTFPGATHKGSSFSKSSPTLVTVFLIEAILMGAKCHLLLVLI